jgi:hypothetical protein
MTSFGATSLKAHLQLKGLKFHDPALAAQYSGHLRVVTPNKLFAKDALKLRNGKGMKRDFSYVKITETFGVEVRGLACYGFRREEVDAYCLTSHAMRKVVEGIRGRREWMRGRVKDEGEKEKVAKEKVEKERAEKAKVEGGKVERANVEKAKLEEGRVKKQNKIEKRVASQKKMEKAVEKRKKTEKRAQKQKKAEKGVEKQKKVEKRVETQKKKVKMMTKMNAKAKTNKARRERSHCPHNGGVRKSVNLGTT